MEQIRAPTPVGEEKKKHKKNLYIFNEKCAKLIRIAAIKHQALVLNCRNDNKTIQLCKY